MTSIENTLALYLVKENFGDSAREVAAFLIKKTSCPFFLISDNLNIEKKKLSNILSILITHYLVEYDLNARQVIEYHFKVNKALNLMKIPRSINIIKHFQNDPNVEFIVNELFHHGCAEMSGLLLKLLAKKFNQPDMKAQANNSQEIYETFNELTAAFNQLVEDKFLERLPQLSVDDEMTGINNKPKIPLLVSPNEHLAYKYLLPRLVIDCERMKKSIREDSETACFKIRKLDEELGDTGIYWRINEKRVLQFFRDQALADALEKRIDKNASNILRVIMKLSDAHILEKAEAKSCQSKPVTAIDIQRVMRSDHKMDSAIVDKYLSVILQDSFKVIEKIGDFSGGAFCIDFRKALESLCLANIESYIRERYDTKSLRIFRVILEKSKLEQKQIEDFSMIPSKECKALVYNMVNDGLLSLTELSKTSDHAPSRTYYLFYIDVYLIAKKLLENSYKSMNNLMIKRDQLCTENKRLFEKSEKIKSRIELLIAQGAEQSEIDYEKSIMSLDETSRLNSFTTYCNKIELAEIQLEETIFLFENYFYYHTIPPAVQPKK